MGQSEKPWTTAIREFLSDGEDHLTADAIAAGAAVVTSERAAQEMGSKASGRSEEDRLKSGRKNVAKMAINGMVRFGKASYSDDKKTIRWISEDSTSIGEVSERVRVLEEQVSQLLLNVEALQSTVDFLEKKDAGDAPAEEFLASVGINSKDE